LFQRKLHLPIAGTETFFLWGPRQTTKRLIVVCCEEKPRRTEGGIEILPAQHFVRLLWNNEII